ncbi:MAG TPA: hypothetical protein VHR38_03205 [Solirubrobacterales bacterium]|jgi:hypothetical protein|nr:hypothetical protein [Solirubrobacterales bacterium]
MTRLPEGRREVYPSRSSRPKRRAPDFGPGLNVSVPISFGLPLVVVGIGLVAAAVASGGAVFWITGAVALAAGILLFASGKRL